MIDKSNVSPLISVVICTFNRSNLLIQVLTTLVCQTISFDKYEIIIVDNNSNDATRDLSSFFISDHPHISIRYILEPNQGLSYARNRGWKEAKGEYVAYVDDDCEVPNEWLKKAEEIIERMQPVAFGGPYYPFYSSPKPIWFKDEYGSHVQGSESRNLHEGEYLDGANLFIRRDILKLLGGFNLDLGMSGEKIAYGEETALLVNIRRKIPGAIIFYEPDLYIFHLVSERKMILSWNLKNSFISGLYAHHALNSDKNDELAVLKRLLYGIFLIVILYYNVTIGSIYRDHEKYPYVQNYFYEHCFKHIAEIGVSFGYFRKK